MVPMYSASEVGYSPGAFRRRILLFAENPPVMNYPKDKASDERLGLRNHVRESAVPKREDGIGRFGSHPARN